MGCMTACPTGVASAVLGSRAAAQLQSLTHAHTMWTLRRNSAMRILYVFPHPDDESFGPARAMAAQRRQGHAVYLLTLTRGEATKVRHSFGWTSEQMGEVRYRELLNVKRTLDLNDTRVLNLPDGA